MLSVHRVISQIKEKNDQKVAVTERVKYSCKNQNRQVLEDFSSAAIAVFALNSDGLWSNRNHIGKATVPLQYRAQTPTSSLVSQAIKKICRKKRKKKGSVFWESKQRLKMPPPSADSPRFNATLFSNGKNILFSQARFLPLLYSVCFCILQVF